VYFGLFQKTAQNKQSPKFAQNPVTLFARSCTLLESATEPSSFGEAKKAMPKEIMVPGSKSLKMSDHQIVIEVQVFFLLSCRGPIRQNESLFHKLDKISGFH
jgi:hypothetical protein